MNKKLIALLTALSCMAAPLTAYARSDEDLAADYDSNRANIQGSTAPTETELKNRVQAAKDAGNKAKIKSYGTEDYSTYVADTDNIIVSIDENDMWEYNDEIYGIQMELFDAYSEFYQKDDLKNDFKQFAERAGKIPVIRLGGASSMGVNPLNLTGPKKDRKSTPATSVRYGTQELTGGGAKAFEMGIPEWLEMTAYLNGGEPASLIICPNIWSVPEEDFINMAKYCYDEADESEWGALRAADGWEEPLDIFYWELGNELDWMRERDEDLINAYVEYAIKATNAIRSVNPDAPIMANGVTAPWGAFWGIPEYTPGSWTIWHMGIMPRLVSMVDAIAYHPYYDGYSPEFGAIYFADKMKRDIDKMVEEQDIRDKDGNLKDIKVVATEHNRFTPYPKINNDFDSAVCVSHYYNLTQSRPWYQGATLHCLMDDWSALWYTAGGSFIMTPTAKMHKMYVENAGDRICKSGWVRVEDDGTIYDPVANLTPDSWMDTEEFSVLAMPSGEHELKVFLTGKSAYKNFNITFEFANHSYTLVEETKLSAPNSGTYAIDEESEGYTTVTTKEMNVPNCTTYTTPTEGVVVLTFRTTDRMLQLGEDPLVAGGAEIADAPEAEELAFSDIGSSYAKNEITSLAAQGLISGRTAETFAPTENISRGEFAYILAKAMKLKEYKGQLIADVPSDSWYAGMINSLYIENIISGTHYRPEEPMTIKELMDFAGKLCKNKEMTASGDISGVEAQLGADAAYAINKGIFSKLLQQGELDTDRYVTREDAAAVMYKLSRMV